MRGTEACQDCVVDVLVGLGGRGRVYDLATKRAIRLLERAGMLAPVEYRSVS